jgi:broad specificity phosphatase PhoE
LSVYLIRHATPDLTRRELPYHEVPGPPLTELGEREAAALGEYLRRVGVRRLYTSPLERCQRTARIAARSSGAQVLEDGQLIEWQPGEDSVAVRGRIWPVFEAVCQQGETAGLVTHGGPIRVLLEALGMDPGELSAQHSYDNGNPLPPAGVWRVHRDGRQGEWELRLDFSPGDAGVRSVD